MRLTGEFESDLEPAASGRGGRLGRVAVRRESGSAMIPVLAAILICAILAAMLLSSAVERRKLLAAGEGHEVSLAAAEAGVDRVLAESRKAARAGKYHWPSGEWTSAPGRESQVLNADGFAVAEFTVRAMRGDSDGEDNDGNGAKDDEDPLETRYLTVESTGFEAAGNPGKSVVRIRAYFRRSMPFEIPEATVLILDDSPDLSLGNSVAWRVDGRDHDMYLDAPVVGPVAPAISTTGGFPLADIGMLSNASKAPRLQIAGTNPPWSEYVVRNIDIPTVVEWARKEAGARGTAVFNAPGSVNPAGPFGVAAKPGSPVVEPVCAVSYHDAGLRITGSKEGAGVWVVNGDLIVSGTVQFTGIVVVNGRVEFRGGGADNHITGALIVGGSSQVNFDCNGTTDVLRSTDAVNMAIESAGEWAMVGWRLVSER